MDRWNTEFDAIGTLAYRMPGPYGPEMVNVSDSVETVDFFRLIAAGIEEEDAITIARHAAFRFDRNRKPKGSPSGVLGSSGLAVYEALANDPKAFAEYQPYTTKMAADRVNMSEAAIGPAAKRLIVHGFMDKRRNGRGFLYRVTLPKVALVECAENYLAADQPGTLWYDYERPLGETIMKMLANT